MNRTARILFLAISVALCLSGTWAIVTRHHVSSSRHTGISVATGADAVRFGQTCFLLAALPLCVFLPARWLKVGLALWWVALMAWLFLPFVLR